MKKHRTGRILLRLLFVALVLILLAFHLYPRYLRSLYKIEYQDAVETYAAAYGVPTDVCYAVILTESGFNEAAVSHAGAVGLMQLTPSTFTYLCGKLGEDLPAEAIYDADVNLRCGIYYLSMLYARFGVWETAFAAYNAGPSRVSRWLKESGEDGRLSEIPIEETKNYVARVSRAREYYQKLYP